MKYKVGDKVRIVKKWNKYTQENVDGKMDKWLGKVMTVRAVEGAFYRMKEDCAEWCGSGWHWNEYCIAGLAENGKKIVITSDGEETLARLYEDGKVVKSATAKCSPEDEFDFSIGARLAFDRLIESTAEKKQEYYNGKVVCVERGYKISSPLSCFTVGKVYTVTDGVLVADGGYRTERYETLERLCVGVGHKLIPLVEETKGE